MTIAILGTFDVANYGDLLFPLIARRRLAQLGEIVAVSPTGGRPWEGALSSVDVDTALADPAALGAVSGVLLGGGNLLHANATSRVYARLDPPRPLAYPSLWIGAARLAASHRAPLCWNAPGAPAPFSPTAARFLARAAVGADPCTVRDEGSRALVAAAGVDARVVPDTGFDVAALWEPDDLAERRRALLDAAGRPATERTLALHVSPRRVTEPIPAIARAFDRIAAACGAVPWLVALGPCHGDGPFLREIADAMDGPSLLLDAPHALIDVTAVLAGSAAYLGSSMHGAVTAIAFGRPARLVTPGAHHKLDGLLDHLGRPPLRLESWADAATAAPALEAAPPLASALARVRHLLDSHWDAIARRVESGASDPIPSEDALPSAHEIAAELATEMLAAAADRVSHLEDGLARAHTTLVRRTGHARRLEAERGALRQRVMRLETALEDARRDRASLARLGAADAAAGPAVPGDAAGDSA